VGGGGKRGNVGRDRVRLEEGMHGAYSPRAPARIKRLGRAKQTEEERPMVKDNGTVRQEGTALRYAKGGGKTLALASALSERGERPKQ